jgi:transposase-like protein
MVAIIREADRDPVAAVAKRHGISEQTIDSWRKRFGALQANEVPPKSTSASTTTLWGKRRSPLRQKSPETEHCSRCPLLFDMDFKLRRDQYRSEHAPHRKCAEKRAMECIEIGEPFVHGDCFTSRTEHYSI